MTVTIDDIRAAAHAIGDAVVRTPLLHSRTLSKITGAHVLLKFENQQFTASFKDRGALNKLLSLTPGESGAGVIAASAGNHAQGVAYHAQRLGIPATIVMPEATPFTKVVHTRDYGARVILHGQGLSESAERAMEIAKAQGLTFIHPYDDERIIAGQGTIGLEILEDDPEIECLVAPIGGGGLISGVATAAKAFKPGIEVIGVEAELYPSMHQALKGLPPTSGGQTLAEGIAVKDPGAITRRIVERLVDEVLLVDECTTERAVQMLIEIEKTVVEGAGATPLAALLAHPGRFRGKRTGLILSGGNIDSRLLASILMRGLAREGRLARFRLTISDAPGVFAKAAKLIGDTAGNIIEVTHQRLFYDVPVKMAELDVVVETRDSEHVHEIESALNEAGFPARVLRNTASNSPEGSQDR